MWLRVQVAAARVAISPTCNLTNMSTLSFQQSAMSLKHTYLSLLRPVAIATSVAGGKRLGWLHIVGVVIYPSLGGNVTIVMSLYVNCVNEIVFLISTLFSYSYLLFHTFISCC